jgi:hypothetical protein
VEAGAEESLLRHYVPSLGILWVPHADLAREACGSRHVTGVFSHATVARRATSYQ